jgi:MurNAc alpha-1-phosphate uridylyltransferase
MKAMILAAGYGKRLRPLTNTTPKPLLVVGGKPLLQHHIERLAAAGITELVINTSWLGAQIEDYFADGADFGVQISWSREPEPLETGGGIANAIPLLGSDPFLLINGDIWTDVPLGSLDANKLEIGLDAWILLVNNPEHNPNGDFGVTDHLVTFQDKPYFTYSGISLLRPQLFSAYKANNAGIQSFRWLDVLAPCIKAGLVGAEVYTGDWWDVGTVERYQQLNQYLK